MSKRYIPLLITMLLFLIVLAMQFYFIAADKDTGYKIVGAILVFLAALAALIQINLLKDKK